MCNARVLAVVTAAAVLGLMSLGAGGKGPQEESVTIDQVPAPVKAAILKETVGGKIREIEAETVGGRTTYEVEFVRGGQIVEIAIAADGTLLADDDEKAAEAKGEEQERTVTEGEVPPAALAALKKLAGDAALREFSEEIEHGGKFYEGSWKTAAGSNVDALVTETGDLVELEEEVPAGDVPAAVRAAVGKLAGPDGKLFCERKTMILYEVKFRAGEQRHELLYTPDGRVMARDIEAGESDSDE